MNRAQMLFATDSLVDLVKTAENTESVYFIPTVEDLSDDEKIEDEYEALGFFITKSPLDDHLHRLNSLTAIDDVITEGLERKVHLGGMITDFKKITTKKGKDMAFFVLEDLTGRIEVVVFPSIYERNKFFFEKNKVIELIGYSEIQTRIINGEEVNISKIKAMQLQDVEDGKVLKKVVLYPYENDDLVKISDIIKSNPGEIDLEVSYHNFSIPAGYKVANNNKVIKELEFLCRLEKIY